MSKVRMVNTRFWSDTFIREQLNPLDRYLYLYFLTNDKTNICGIYELPMAVTASETGLDAEMLKKMMVRLNGKVDYYEGWVCVRNFLKYQNTDNPKIIKGIEVELAKIPPSVAKHLYDIDSLSIDYIYPSVNSNLNSNPNPNSNSNLNNAPQSDIVTKLIEEKGGIQYDYQFVGLEIFDKLQAPANKKGECIRLAKVYPQYINHALSFSLDYPNPTLKWKMFLWKLNNLIKENETHK